MTEKHTQGRDGILEDGVGFRPASASDLATFDRASAELSTMKAPLLLSGANQNERLFVACFDGTWNDMVHDPQHRTNVAMVFEQLQDAAQRDPRIATRYETGIGTVGSKVEKVVDGALGYSYDARIEDLYSQFARQAKVWLRENPNAEIRIADMGFSRGAEEAAGFARLVAERGIADPETRKLVRDARGRVHVEYGVPPMVSPGLTPQVLALIDPVGTGHPRDHDRRPPPSVISGIQLVALDERRNLFQSTSILDPGMSADGRFLSMSVAGAHSDLGGGYHHDGLSRRTFNVLSDYLNGLCEAPLLRKVDVPENPAVNVIHRSEEGAFFYRTSVFDAHGERGRVEALAPRGTSGDRFNAEPRDEAMASRFEFRPVVIGPAPSGVDRDDHKPHETPRPPPPSLSSGADRALHAQALAGVRRLDAELGRTSDAVTERVAAAMLPVAREARLERIDRVVRSDDGRHLFAVQGELTSPSNRWARVDAAVAANTPVETSLQALGTLSAELERRKAVTVEAQDISTPKLAPVVPARTIGAL